VNKFQELDDIAAVLHQRRLEMSKEVGSITVTPLNSQVVNLEIRGEPHNVSLNVSIRDLREIVGFINECTKEDE
jgi:CO dehydrogenase nickel-insertion accessory protein CooC1